MKVKDLIKLLEQYDPELNVELANWENSKEYTADDCIKWLVSSSSVEAARVFTKAIKVKCKDIKNNEYEEIILPQLEDDAVDGGSIYQCLLNIQEILEVEKALVLFAEGWALYRFDKKPEVQVQP